MRRRAQGGFLWMAAEPELSLGLSCAALGVGVALSCWGMIAAGNFAWQRVVISYLMLRAWNPLYFSFAIGGVVASGALLIPVVVFLAQQRWPGPRRMKQVACGLMGLGIAGLLSLAVTSLILDDIGPVHDDLTVATLAGLLTGMGVYSAMAIRAGHERRMLGAMLGVTALAMIGLGVVFAETEFFVDAPWWRCLATCEVTMCLFLASYLLLLIRVSRSFARKARS